MFFSISPFLASRVFITFLASRYQSKVGDDVTAVVYIYSICKFIKSSPGKEPKVRALTN